jgi:hypothetical protein
MVIIGSHDSCACVAKDDCMCICWLWAKTQDISLKDQFALGVRLFDLRYHMDNNVYYMSHTFSTSYTVENALTELIKCAVEANEYIYIRLKRDSSSPALPSFGSFFTSILIHDIPITTFMIEYDGSTLWQYLNAKPDRQCIVLYSDNDTLRDDHIPAQWIFPQLFDTVETWDCSSIDSAAQRIRLKPFRNNGLPKAIFIDFSGVYPPEMIFDYLWEQIEDDIMMCIHNNVIQCIMVNHINATTIQLLRRS